ncbi:aldehyde dehydrogenase family protein [Sorangium sp. So ce176]|uniref:aldehyde dehydrogenase family protein n=1 Tax=Sorangium sp. So ce176 TaxID=3133286 RepID=UPI003F602D9D
MESKTTAFPHAAGAEADEAAALRTPGATASAGPFPVSGPAGGEPLDDVAETAPSAVGEIVVRARAAQRVWAEVPIGERAELIGKVKRRLLARAEEIAALLHRECGKPIEEAALAEVLPNADLIDYWTVSIEELLDEVTVDLNPLAYPGKAGRVRREPRGVVALITPWNYPVSIPLRTIVPALLAGNAVVFKPSEVTPRSGALVALLFDGLLPDGVLAVAQGGGDVGAALIDAGVDLVVFTGSVATGKKVAVACAERLVPTSLELGGKDSAIVLDDCDLERAARGVVWGAFTNAGQNCASIERVYVEQAIADRFIERVVALTGQLRAGIDVGRMTTARQADIVRRQLEAAVADGAELLAGGAPEPGSLAFPPTVLKVEREDTPLLREETFGPVLPVLVVNNAEEAIARTNASRFALTTSLWTRGYERAHVLARRLRSGVVTINNHGFTGALPAAPWTGTGDSGFGVTSSPHALAELTRPRFYLEDRSRAKSELWWYPYTPALRTIAFAMARVRGGAGWFGRISALVELVAAFARRMLGR